MARMIGQSMSWGLSTLFRLTHPLLFNSSRYTKDELVVSGGLVLAATLSTSASVLFFSLMFSNPSILQSRDADVGFQ
jgi:hypothetical protein